MKHACPECSSNNLEEHFADYLNPISIGIICKDCGCRFVTNKNQKHCEIVMHGSKYDENEKIKELYACPNCNSSNTKQISKQEQKEVLTYKCYDCGYIFYPTDDQFMSRALEFIKHNYTSKQIPLLISDIIDLYPDNSININEIMKKLQAKKNQKEVIL